jgi:hypothetical protein
MVELWLPAGMVVMVVALLYGGWRRGRLGLAAGAAAAGLLAIWIAAAIAVATDYRDADGMMDCWPSCTAFQDTVQVAYLFSLPLLLLAALAALVLWFVAVMRRRGRAARRPG